MPKGYPHASPHLSKVYTRATAPRFRMLYTSAISGTCEPLGLVYNLCITYAQPRDAVGNIVYNLWIT